MTTENTCTCACNAAMTAAMIGIAATAMVSLSAVAGALLAVRFMQSIAG